MYEKHEGRWVETLQSHSHHSDPAAILEAIEEQGERAYTRNSQMLCTGQGQAAILSGSSHRPSLKTTPSIT